MKANCTETSKPLKKLTKSKIAKGNALTKPTNRDREKEKANAHDTEYKLLFQGTDLRQIDEERFSTIQESTQLRSKGELIDPIYQGFVIVEGLAVGNVGHFMLSFALSIVLPVVGFIWGSMSPTSHAAKHGSWIGLGVLLVMYGFSIHPAYKTQQGDQNEFGDDFASEKLGELIDFFIQKLLEYSHFDTLRASIDATYFASGIIAAGLFIILRSLAQMYRIKQAEKRLLAPRT